MRDVFLVGAGGFIGSVARYWLGGFVMHTMGAPRFPYATLSVNLLGCLVIGALSSIAEQGHLLTPAARLLLFTGVLGGFTTFSAFGYETYFLAREAAWPSAFLNVLLHVGLALPAVWLGHWLAGILPQ